MITTEMLAEMDQIVDNMQPGFALAAKKLRCFYDALRAEHLPEDIILAEITAWCRGESRLVVEPALHHFYIQQHQSMSERVTPDASE